MSIKKMIKKAMLDKGIKSGFIADKLDIDRQFLYNWLYKPDTEAFERLVAIADILGCDVALIDRESGNVYN